jgi:hypothetical protein
MNDIRIEMINTLNSICFRQLTSLIIKGRSEIPIEKLELFLLMTSSLVYLKLNGGEKMMDGKRWEEFITKNLLQLNKFEFSFTKTGLSIRLRKISS